MLTPRVPEALAFYAAMGFRLSEYLGPSEEDIRGVFLQRKGNPHDIVFFTGEGPRLHHFAYFSPEVHHLLRACDVAGVLGFGRDVERGPGRHGPGHAMYVYFRDPDGHRVELFWRMSRCAGIPPIPMSRSPGACPRNPAGSRRPPVSRAQISSRPTPGPHP